MKLNKLQWEEIGPLKSSSEFLGVLEDSIFPLLGVWVAFSHLAPKWGCNNFITRENTKKIELHLEELKAPIEVHFADGVPHPTMS